MNLKPPKTLEEQVAKLKEHHMIVDNEESTKEILSEINYYRFTGYALQHRISVHSSAYVDNVSFDSVYNIYKFDESLRAILRKYLEKVEVYYRTLISYTFANVKCKMPPHNQHYDEINFFNKTGFNEVMESFKKEKNYYKDSLIVKHHKSKYGSNMPLWVIVELMSFSNLSKLYSSMYISEKELIASEVGITYEVLENHLHCLSVLRNKCAHAARLYNTNFNPPAKLQKKFLKQHPSVKNNTLFAYLLILMRNLPQKASKLSFIADLNAVIEKYMNDIDISKIGFPEDYEKLLKIQIQSK